MTLVPIEASSKLCLTLVPTPWVVRIRDEEEA